MLYVVRVHQTASTTDHRVQSYQHLATASSFPTPNGSNSGSPSITVYRFPACFVLSTLVSSCTGLVPPPLQRTNSSKLSRLRKGTSIPNLCSNTEIKTQEWTSTSVYLLSSRENSPFAPSSAHMFRIHLHSDEHSLRP
jgi:hypothetical protein